MISQVNAFYDAGHRVILFTARGTTTGINWREETEKQLSSWGVKYHELIFGKPEADVFVDDKSLGPRTWAAVGLTQTMLNQSNSVTEGNSVLKNPDYLKVTYSQQKAPKGLYPDLLAQWLFKNIYRRSGRLLDLGCGRGDHIHAWTSLGFQVAGVDVSLAAGEDLPSEILAVADLERDPLPFPSESFDFVFSKSVIEHMRFPERLLDKAMEALKPGGIAVVMTPSWRHTYWGPFYIDHTHITPFTAPSLSDAMTIAGFQDVQVSHFHQLPFTWRSPFLKLVAYFIAALPLPYRPINKAPWPESVNKLIRFSNEVMLLGVGIKPSRTERLL